MKRLSILNPFFLWRKRRSILNRILELPDDIRWKLIYPFIESGYVQQYDHKSIRELRNIHKDKVGFLLGNGLSVKIEDLNKVAKSEMVVFGCNRIHLSYAMTDLKPKYVLSADEQMIEDFGQGFIDNNENVLLISKKRPFFRGKYVWFKLKNGRPFRFSFKPEKEVMPSGGTIIATIQIGYAMGIRKFYLYGVDHNFNFDKVASSSKNNARGDDNHFIKGYRSGKDWQAPVYDLVEDAFMKCDKILRIEGGFLLNATRGGALNVLERASFDEIINNV